MYKLVMYSVTVKEPKRLYEDIAVGLCGLTLGTAATAVTAGFFAVFAPRDLNCATTYKSPGELSL